MNNDQAIDENELPRWLIRRWRLLKSVLSNPDFLKVLPGLVAEYQTKNLPTANCFKVIRNFNIPGDCAPAIWAILEHPELVDSEQELIKHIRPPIEYVSYKAEQRGLADNPHETFRYWEQKRQELRAHGSDFIEEFDGIFLEIASYTTKTELMGFIDEYFDSRLKPLLQDGEGHFTPSGLRGGRVTVPSKLKERILALHREGKTPKEIERALGYRHWASNISRIISEAKKSDQQR